MDQFVPPEGVTASGDSALQTQTLESVASAVNYHRWLTALAQPHLGDSPLELGSGLGDYAQTWLDQGLPSITVTEVDASRLAVLSARFADDPRVTVSSIDVFRPPSGRHSAYVAFNVLEHIDADVEALRAAHTLVRPGGAVVMFVPAFEFAMSRFDRSVGHVRRYTTTTLTQAFTSAGLEDVHATYVNMPGLAAWFVGMRLLRMTPGEGPLLSVWDRAVVPLARRWEKTHRAPFGQSVFAVGRVPVG
ncbi:class I SAM-dependent methyltransferase [Lapillicoccus sp.]|uniref:class I SAM-dependent methyltransferase n=1 Tax=Lapillicoccus sp. TaxID=1909287 RepID=UPI0025CC5849|nr:class I SAM-dependent methyltransferase [Lapillicoccus sp.]